MKKISLASWIAGIFGIELDAELSEIVEEEDIERAEEEKIGSLLKKKKEIMERLSKGLSNITEISQAYTAKNMLGMIFGRYGLIKLNEKLMYIDEKLMDESRKEMEELKKERRNLKKEGLDEAYNTEQRIYSMHKEMRGLFNLFNERIKEENRILKDGSTFGMLLNNTMDGIVKLHELNEMIAEIRKDLKTHSHEILKKSWQAKIIEKFDELNGLSMSAKERKELLTHIRAYLTNPIKAKYKEDTAWVEELEHKLEMHEHMKRTHSWESRLERAIWDLSEEIRKEKIMQQHMEAALAAIEKEMGKFKAALEMRGVKLVA
jgi:hypothetical protein